MSFEQINDDVRICFDSVDIIKAWATFPSPSEMN